MSNAFFPALFSPHLTRWSLSTLRVTFADKSRVPRALQLVKTTAGIRKQRVLSRPGYCWRCRRCECSLCHVANKTSPSDITRRALRIVASNRPSGYHLGRGQNARPRSARSPVCLSASVALSLLPSLPRRTARSVKSLLSSALLRKISVHFSRVDGQWGGNAPGHPPPLSLSPSLFLSPIVIFPSVSFARRPSICSRGSKFAAVSRSPKTLQVQPQPPLSQFLINGKSAGRCATRRHKFERCALPGEQERSSKCSLVE